MPRLRLDATLGLNKTGFDAGLRQATQQVARFGQGLAAAFSAAAVTSWVRGVATATNRIKDLSEQFAITTDEVQNADFALEQSGMKFEDMAGAMAKIGTTRREAVEGNEDLRRTFERFGITLDNLNDPQLRNFDLLLKLAKATAGMNLTAREQVELTDLLGTKALRLANVLSQLETVRPHRLFTPEDIEAIDRAEKALKELRRTGQVESAPIIAANANLLTAGIKAASDLFTGRRPEGSSVPGFKGGKMGVAEMFGRLLGDRMTQLMLGEPAKKEAGKAVGGLLEKIFGKPAAPAGGLFQIDKDVKEKKEKAGKKELGRLGGIEESPLGRIGVFTGAQSEASLSAGARMQIAELKEIKAALVQKGILVRDVA